MFILLIAINASFPGRMKWFSQVILFVVAFLLTIVVQSSKIITATLVPLCGIGIVSLQRVFVMTLGSNIGKLGEKMSNCLPSDNRQPVLS